jgi:carnosine N-methyltransferase
VRERELTETGQIIRKATSYETLHSHVHDLYATNGLAAAAVVAAARRYYGVTQDELDRYVAVQEYNEKWDNQERVTEALQHLYRDWAAEGAHERDVPFAAIIGALAAASPEAAAAAEKKKEGGEGAAGKIRVLVPGSGLGRLAHDIAARLPGAAVTANEYSSYMRLVYRLVETLSPTPEKQMALHPFIDWWSHQASRAGMTRAVRFPDAAPDPSVLLVEGDFTTQFVNQTGHYDAVATFFFVDTATNMLDYLDVIARVLKPGGVWVNLGPLLYHKAAVELALDDVIAVAEEYGFEFLDVDEAWGPLKLPGRKARTRDISYLCDTDSMRRNVYSTALFAARLGKKKD